ncbi:methyltransferase domain-containing protein [Chaetomidium leptoderma]|uniref:Protein-lysine N-methyltransferase EFM4 n=1 Tax=Chaetomidium leptoderma TaxID=669021 RepID=A0AAN6VUH3_9PEZI|nr:methyltransferase domain-containing protein [Chaetomidium leptoderma]
MADPLTPTHLDSSALGTKEYWDKLYETELSNHADNPADTGTVWFDDADAEAKMVAYLDEHAAQADYALDRATASVLDLGCGNGSLLFALRDDGWGGRLVGVDYSARSVELARRVGVSRRGGGGDDDTGEREEEEKEEEVEFKVWDVLGGSLDHVRNNSSTTTTTTTIPSTAAEEEEAKETTTGWDLVLDKGTFDAISLSDERDGHDRRICEGYGERVLQLLRTGGIFLVTSCNWTERELREWFETKAKTRPTTETETETGARLRLAGKVEYPSFSFGGIKGQTISTLCFEKVNA